MVGAEIPRAAVTKAKAELHTVITKACGTKLAFGDVLAAAGVGVALRGGECTALGTSVDSLDGIGDCLVAEHACRVDQLVIGETPRAGEFGALVP